LVLGYFRTASSFLSIVRALSSELRIAVMPTAASSSLRAKTGEAEALFLRLCEHFGARIVSGDASIHAELMVVQQFPYPPEVVDSINRSVVAKRRVGLMTLTTAGLEPHDQFLAQFGIRKAYVPSRRFMDFLIGRRQAAHRYAGVEVVEVGLPFSSYPVFPEFKADWLIAVPTLFSFSTEEDKQQFLRTILALLSRIDPNDTVAYKPHNGNVLDYFAPRVHYAFASVVRVIPGVENMLMGLSGAGLRSIRHHAARIITSMLHQRVLERATPMLALTPYGDMSLEAFLPGVRKGIIGGLSNTIWGTIYFGLPFFNCVNRLAGQSRTSELLNKSSETLLDLNLEYFGVPFCAGDVSKGARGEEIVREGDRQGDLVRSIRHDLDHGSHDQSC
jgi:hypothetical protein